jgi:hypothetical protein
MNSPSVSTNGQPTRTDRTPENPTELPPESLPPGMGDNSEVEVTRPAGLTTGSGGHLQPSVTGRPLRTVRHSLMRLLEAKLIERVGVGPGRTAVCAPTLRVAPPEPYGDDRIRGQRSRARFSLETRLDVFRIRSSTSSGEPNAAHADAEAV